MSRGNLWATVVAACVLVAGFAGAAPVANAISAAPSILQRGESAKNNVIEIKHRHRRGKRGTPLYVPIVPYSAYDYPYYYRRGYYPTHIGPGYIYYGYPYFYRMKYSDRCSYRQRRCAASRKGACRCR